MRRLSVALLFSLFLLYPPTTQAADLIMFPETGFAITGRFREYWQSNGGLAQFGLPISPVLSETGEDGVARQVQYFERNRFELHLDQARPYDVLLGRLGVSSLARRGVNWQSLPPAASAPGCRFFPETRHNLCAPFAAYWRDRGGLAVFGLPITEAFPEVSPTDGRTYTVQYFERNRLEFHPENKEPYRIQLGLLGTEMYGRRALAPPTLDPVLQRVLDLLNAARRQAGLQPLTASGSLQATATNYSRVLAVQGRIDHTGPDGATMTDRITASGYAWSLSAENLAAGQPTPDAVFASWINSPAHRANILNPTLRDIGIGYTHLNNDSSGYFDYWVLEFGAPPR